MRAFLNRGYSLTVGDWKTADGWKIDHLQVRFDVSKSTNEKDSKNSAVVEVYNLSPEHIKTLETPYLIADFSVGYYGKEGALTDIKRLFVGEVVKVTTRKSGPDVVTQLELGEGYLELNHAVLSKLVSPGKTVKDVFEEIRQSVPNISRGVYAGTNVNNRILSGYPLMGEPRRLLDKLAEAYSVDYRIDDNVLYVNDSTGAINNPDAQAFVVSQDSGLIDIPYVVQSGSRRSKEDEEAKNATQWKMLLNPDIKPGEIVRLEYMDFTGWYKVESVRHTGDFRGSDWYTEVRCTQNIKTS